MADDKISKPIACNECRKPFVRTHGRQRICPDCKRAVKTGKDVESPAQAKKWAERVTSTKKPTGGGASRRSKRAKAKPRARAAAPVAEGNGTGSGTAARIRGLVQAVAAGKSAQAELDAIRKVMAGA